jgi:branched-subunit amino acid transport protein
VTIWLVVIGLAATTVLVKALGPVLFGGRQPHPASLRVIAMAAPALLAALAATALLADGRRLALGANAVGLLVAGGFMWWRRSVLGSVVVAVLVTALVRRVV